jgi:hypothetical protein
MESGRGIRPAARWALALATYRIPHAFELYQGSHVNHIPERIETKVLPFFSKHLAFSATER